MGAFTACPSNRQQVTARTLALVHHAAQYASQVDLLLVCAVQVGHLVGAK